MGLHETVNHPDFISCCAEMAELFNIDQPELRG